MSHIEPDSIHAYQNRAKDLRILVNTTEDHSDFTSLAFEVADITKTDLTPVDHAEGFTVDLTLTAGELDFDPATLWWELTGTFGGEKRTLAQGPLVLDPEPVDTYPWITPADIAAAYPAASDVTPGFIAHIQGLAEVVTGTQEAPISNRLKSVFVEIVHRRSLASNDDISQESIGSYSYTRNVAPGQGLTDRERKDLKRAIGKRSLTVIPTTRGRLETFGREDRPEFETLL